MNKQVKLIVWSKSDFFFKNYLSSDYDFLSAYRFDSSRLITILRTILFKIGFNDRAFWFNKKLESFNGTYIVFDAMVSHSFLKWLRQKNPNAHIVFWYWNLITPNKVQPADLKKLGFDVWSFNINDCEKYDLKLNHSFYYKKIYQEFNKKYKQGENRYDLSFIGRDKGRMQLINRLLGRTECHGIKTYLYFIANNVFETFKHKNYKMKSLSYFKTLEIEKNSKAILELVPEGSAGITLRTLDALCLGIKLVTNNTRIIETSLYNEDNIFVLGYDNLQNLKGFLEKDFKPIDDEILMEYDMDHWINRFLG